MSQSPSSPAFGNNNKTVLTNMNAGLGLNDFSYALPPFSFSSMPAFASPASAAPVAPMHASSPWNHPTFDEFLDLSQPVELQGLNGMSEEYSGMNDGSLREYISTDCSCKDRTLTSSTRDEQ
jgi:hypothetical protein